MHTSAHPELVDRDYNRMQMPGAAANDERSWFDKLTTNGFIFFAHL
jgi:hypothetical protein